MRLRTFYTIAILLPLVALAAVAALGGGERGLSAGLPPGATAVWLYPTSAVRGLVAYAIVAAWLLWELHRRTPAGFAPLLWLLPPMSHGRQHPGAGALHPGPPAPPASSSPTKAFGLPFG